jgi:hypothetical protein
MFAVPIIDLKPHVLVKGYFRRAEVRKAFNKGINMTDTLVWTKGFGVVNE